MRNSKTASALAAFLALAAALLSANASEAQQYCGPYGCSVYPPAYGTRCSGWKWTPAMGNYKICEWPYHG